MIIFWLACTTYTHMHTQMTLKQTACALPVYIKLPLTCAVPGYYFHFKYLSIRT